MRRVYYKSRLYIIFLIFISFFVLYACRIFYLQFYRSAYLTKIAATQHKILLEIEPQRGDIFDRNLHRLAMDCRVDSVYAMPNEIDKKAKPETAKHLSKILNMDRDIILGRLQQERYFTWIKRELNEKEADEIAKSNLKGISLLKEYKRFYPNGSFASHVIGFAGIDDVGLEGVELAYNEYLKGASGWRWAIRDAKRRDIPSEDIKFIPPSDGLSIALTIDEVIQHIAEREIEGVYKKYNAKGATIVVMNPQNGDILALANRPSYDLNKFSSASQEIRRNRAITDLYEPGSVFKIVTASCAIESKKVEMDQKFFCENGQYYTGGRMLHDHRPHGTLTFREVVEKSSNIGVTKVAQLLGGDEIYRFIKLFGFGEPTGIDIPGEARGIIRPPREWSATSISCIPIGQEVAVTSTQLITALSAIANGGWLVKPRLVNAIRDKDGNIIKSFEPAIVRQVLSEESVKKMKEVLTGVVERGTGKAASINRYTAAGKTGTAQKLEPDGRYSHTRFIATFVGFAPVEKPKIAILVTVDEPIGSYYGGSVAAPVFKAVATDVLRYLKIEPDKNTKAVKL